ncbi:anti-sigma-K factor RskA [Constrictibacter sp. MBR-5]|uniref:anti-sigma factor n=1 Tax=Constrictibacter sp. MBR-5 TaxID=3156467 RepID=UPI00339B5CFF
MSPAERNETATRAEEYVLGLLTPHEAAEVEARLVDDADLRTDVAAARDRFLELDLHAEPLPVDPALWDRIVAGLDGRSEADIVPFAPPSVRAARRRGLWQGALAASVAAVLLAGAAILGLPSLREPPPPIVVAVLLDPDTNNPGAVVEAFADDRVRIVPLADIPIPEGRILQVWTLPDAETGPVSLGLMPQAQLTSLLGPDLPRPQARQLYEITLEPAGGSPTGRPTGPILYKGFAEPTR